MAIESVVNKQHFQLVHLPTYSYKYCFNILFYKNVLNGFKKSITTSKAQKRSKKKINRNKATQR